jgi:hypothetical protein
MEFIKRNYEKVILSLVLLGLVGALAFMPVVIYYDQQQMEDMKNKIIPRKAEPLPPLDLSRQQAVLDRLKAAYDLDFSTTNKLFNPVQWKKQNDGTLLKIATGHEVGPDAAVVTKITPLYFSISLDSVNTDLATTNGSGARYVFGIEDQTAAIPAQRHKRPHYASMGKGSDSKVVDKAVGGKDEGFTLVDVKGPPENPDQLVLKLADSGAEVTVSKDKPFRRADAYSADLKYDVEKPAYVGTGLRVGDHMSFGGDDYNVIAIDKNDVILLAQSNQKKYTLPYAP